MGADIMRQQCGMPSVASGPSRARTASPKSVARQRCRRPCVLATVLQCVLAAGASAATPRFSAPVAVDTGPDPARQVAVDLSGDGRPDLAIADGPRSVSVLLGRGDGSFDKRRAFPVARVPLDIASADLDGDGDLVTTSNDRAGTVTVLLNDGAGRFRRDRTYPANAWMLNTADINHDGLIDVLAAAAERSGLVVLLGAGAGRLTAARRYPGADVSDLDLGDLNGDGNLDAALSGDHCDSLFSGYVAVQLGNGDGSFGSATTFRTGGSDPVTVALADFNHDGKLDAAAANYWSANVAIMLGLGDGTFAPRTRYPMWWGTLRALERPGLRRFCVRSRLRRPNRVDRP
jgi:hypothetical protein